jgi:hypothetical protein
MSILYRITYENVRKDKNSREDEGMGKDEYAQFLYKAR